MKHCSTLELLKSRQSRIRLPLQQLRTQEISHTSGRCCAAEMYKAGTEQSLCKRMPVMGQEGLAVRLRGGSSLVYEGKAAGGAGASCAHGDLEAVERGCWRDGRLRLGAGSDSGGCGGHVGLIRAGAVAGAVQRRDVRGLAPHRCIAVARAAPVARQRAD